jgi:hypothetical protein
MKTKVVVTVAALGTALLASSAPAGGAAAATPSSPQSVLDWNTVAVSTILASGQFQAQGFTHLAYVQASVLDAVVAVEHRGHAYVGNQQAPAGASLDAAVATAAHDILALQYPGQSAVYAQRYVDALAAVPDGTSKSDGIAAGHQAAQDLLAARAGDGLEANVPYTFGSGPGVWTLPMGTAATTPQTPWVGQMRPFLIDRPDEFLPPPPPGLTTGRYAKDLEETKAYGSASSTVRTPEETTVARFWSANVVDVYNATMRTVVTQRGGDAVAAATALALTDLVGADSLIGCMNAKYHYSFWRPYGAIRNADTDGNPATTADPSWVPLLPTPNHPEYPAAHGCITSAEGEVLAAVVGTHQIDVDVTSPVTASTRHFDTVAQLTREIVDARVWAGLHYRNSGQVGVRLGRDVAQSGLAAFGIDS